MAVAVPPGMGLSLLINDAAERISVTRQKNVPFSEKRRPETSR